MTHEEKKAICEKEATLDGKPAQITGARMQFATVCQVSDGLSYEWAWETARRITEEEGGKFYS